MNNMFIHPVQQMDGKRKHLAGLWATIGKFLPDSGWLIFLLCSGAIYPLVHAAEVVSKSNDSCVGIASNVRGHVITAPVVPQPFNDSDIVGVHIQNTDSVNTAAHYLSFGQVFLSGRVRPSDGIYTLSNERKLPIQMDALSLWADGSVKLASLTLKVPSLCASSDLPLLIAREKSNDVVAKPVDIKNKKPKLIITLSFSGGSYSGTRTLDLGQALQSSLSDKPDYWLRGPMVTQARVDVPVGDGKSAATSTLHVSADISVYSDGVAKADIQFNNDLATVLPQSGKLNPRPPLPPLTYTANIQLEDKLSQQTISQIQYTSWHTVMWSDDLPAYNIQHDIAQLERTGAILPYDLTLGIEASILDGYQKHIIAHPTFGLPLAQNGVSTYMPGTGGRADIGFTTQFNAVWLVTQDYRAANVALAQSDTSGAIPWNYKLANGKWLSPTSHPKVWIDGRAGPHGSTDGVTNLADTSVWSPDSSHQPNLNYVPYIMTGQRWNLDRLTAQASFNLIGSWPGYRCKNEKCNLVVNGMDELRGQAWALREVILTQFISKDKSAALTEFTETAKDNWSYLITQMKLRSPMQGEASGWLPGDYGRKGVTAQWQQDFFTVVTAWAALMGSADAREVIAAQIPWLSGRFIGEGMNPNDGCTYNLAVYDPGTGTMFKSWKEIELATTEAGLSNLKGWKQSEGYYCQLALVALTVAKVVHPDNSSLRAAHSWLEQSRAPFIQKAKPNFIAPLL